MKVMMLHNDYGAFSGEEAMVDAISSGLNNLGKTVYPIRLPGIVNRGLKGKLQATYYSLLGDNKAQNYLKNYISIFKPNIVQIQNIFPRIGTSIISWMLNQGIPVVMRLSNYRLMCPTGLATRNGNVCTLCSKGITSGAIRYNCEKDPFKSSIYSIRYLLTKKVLWNLSGYIAQTQYQKKMILENTGISSPIKVIPNYYSGEITYKSRLSIPNKKKDSINVCFVGRGAVSKGFITFMEIARSLPTWQFHHFGNIDPGLNTAANSIKNLSVHGFKSKNQLTNYFKNMDALVVPSLWIEGMPNVILHAFALGVPVIASRIGAIPELIKDNVTGLLANPHEVEDFVKKLQYLQKNSPALKEIILKAGLEIEIKYNSYAYFQELISFYEKHSNK